MNEQTTENNKHIWREFLNKAKEDVGSERAEAAADELLTRGAAALEAMDATRLQRGDLTSFELEIYGKAVLRSSWKQRPTAEALLLLLVDQCDNGDLVHTTTNFYGGRIEAEAAWPLDLAAAERLVPDIRLDPVLEKSGITLKASRGTIGKRSFTVIRETGGEKLRPRLKITRENALKLEIDWRYSRTTIEL